MKTNYPWQIYSIIHKSNRYTKTLGMDAMLFSPKEEADGNRTPAAPLEMHEGYSVFKGTLIVKDASTRFLKFNIPANVVPYIHKKTEMVMENSLKESVNAEPAPVNNSKAYTVTIKSGNLKGQTPAGLLSSNPNSKKDLLKQAAWLESNLTKFPGNQEQIDAIEEAISLFNSGKLDSKASSANSTKPIIIYESAPKNIKPLDPEGRYTIYQVTISYNPGMSLPFNVKVMNCFAPVDKTKGNVIVMNEAVNKQSQEILLSEEEWFTMIDKMKATKIMFEQSTYEQQYKLATKISRESYEAAMKHD